MRDGAPHLNLSLSGQLAISFNPAVAATTTQLASKSGTALRLSVTALLSQTAARRNEPLEIDRLLTSSGVDSNSNRREQQFWEIIVRWRPATARIKEKWKETELILEGDK